MKNTLLVAAILLYLFCFIHCWDHGKIDKTEGWKPGEKEETIKLMKLHGVDVLYIKWDDSVWIKRNGKEIRVK